MLWHLDGGTAVQLVDGFFQELVLELEQLDLTF